MDDRRCQQRRVWNQGKSLTPNYHIPFILGIAGISTNNAILLGVTIIVGIFVWRTREGTIWRSNFDGMKEQRDNERVKRLEREGELAEIRSQVVALQERPDFTAVLTVLSEQADRAQKADAQVLEIIDIHERRAEERHKALLDISAKILNTKGGSS